MSKENEHMEENIGVEMAERLEELLGEERGLRLYANLIRAIRLGGKEQAKIFCWNESDKFRERPDLVLFLEKEIFDAGDDGLDTETPWNMMRRKKAKKSD